MFLKSIKVILVSIVFSYQLVGMKPVDISRSTESEYPNLELQNQELINELQKKDEIIDLLRTELDETKQQLADVSDLFIIQTLFNMRHLYFDYDHQDRNDIVAIINENKSVLERLWNMVITENNKQNEEKDDDDKLPLPENLEAETIQRFLNDDE